MKRLLAVGVIVLFLGLAIAPSINANINETSQQTSKNPLLPPLMWTEDFSTFFLCIPNNHSGENVFYLIDWGDGDITGWLGPFMSNETVSISHIWDDGEYHIQVYTKNEYSESKNAEYFISLSPIGKLFLPILGYVDINYKFTIDLEGFDSYIFYWGDGTYSNWVARIANKSYSCPGDYHITIKARDIHNNQTLYPNPILITILPINGAELEIEIVTGLYTGAIIKNVGNEDAYNVNWCISVKGGMLNLVSVSGEGTINVLPHSDLIGTAVRLRQPTLGFGLVEITATAIGENAELVMEKIYGLLLLFWIIQLS